MSNRKIVLSIFIAIVLLVTSTTFLTHQNSLAHPLTVISNMFVSSGNLYVTLNGPENNYHLYVWRTGATFGDDPHYDYYQIYSCLH